MIENTSRPINSIYFIAFKKSAVNLLLKNLRMFYNLLKHFFTSIFLFPHFYSYKEYFLEDEIFSNN